MKIQKKLLQTAGRVLAVSLIVSMALFGFECWRSNGVAHDAANTVKNETQQNLAEDTVSLSNEVSLLLTKYEKRQDTAMCNAALAMQYADTYTKVNVDSMKALCEKTNMTDMYLFKPNGDTQTSTVKAAGNFNLYTVWNGYRQLVTGQKTVLPSNITIQAETGAIYKFMAVPRLDKNGRTNGIVESALNASELESSVKSFLAQKPMLRGISLFQQDGMTLISATNDTASVKNTRGKTSQDTMIKKAFSSDKPITKDGPNGSLLVYSPIKKDGTAAYTLMLEIDPAYYTKSTSLVNTAMGSLIGNTNVGTTIILCASILFFILLVYVIYSYIKKNVLEPIEELCETADRVAQGEVDVELDRDRTDEIGTLYHAFGRVVDGIKEQAQILQTVSAGDFSVSLQARSSNDVLTNSIDAMIHLLNRTIKKIGEVSARVTGSAHTVSESARQLADGVAEQVTGVENLRDTIDAAHKKIHGSRKTAELVADVTVKAGQTVSASMEKAHHAVAAMQQISDKSQEIVKVIKTIDGIAFQTNILALNASVEAARAGQAGKGFSVVAVEVKNLAAKAAQAAKETADLIEEAVATVENGTTAVNESTSTMNEIAKQTGAIGSKVEEIVADCRAETQMMGQLKDTVDAFAETVQHTSSIADECSSSSDSMSEQAQIMDNLEKSFRLR